MKAKIRQALNEAYGDFSSNLENQYEEKVVDILMNRDWETKMQWATYNQLILEIKNTLKDDLKVKELQYRLTDSEDPKCACMDVLSKIRLFTPELERLYNKIMNFI